MEKVDFLIVGAGISGLVLANEIKKHASVCVVEKRKNIGGNCADEIIEGINVHKYGAHIFRTNDAETWKYINQFSQFNNFINSPIAKRDGKVYNLPFNMNTFYQLWGVTTPEEARKKIESQRVKNEAPTNLEEWALNAVGTDIYYTFIKDYTEKQWGKSCKNLPADIMRRIPISYIFDNNYFFGKKWQGIPTNGYMNIFEKMAEGVKVILGKKYRISDFDAKKVIYTGALDELYKYKYGALEWRGLKFKTEVLDIKNFQGIAVANYTGKEPFTRIIEHKHFVFGENEKTVVTKEYPEKWEIGKERFYPIETEKNRKLQNKYLKEAKKDGIIPLGRLAEYKYMDMEEAIRNARKTASVVLNE